MPSWALPFRGSVEIAMQSVESCLSYLLGLPAPPQDQAKKSTLQLGRIGLDPMNERCWSPQDEDGSTDLLSAGTAFKSSCKA